MSGPLVEPPSKPDMRAKWELELPAEATDSVAKLLFDWNMKRARDDLRWDMAADRVRDVYRAEARTLLRAALPHLLGAPS